MGEFRKAYIHILFIIMCAFTLNLNIVKTPVTSTAEAADLDGEWVQKKNGFYWELKDGSILRKGGWHVLGGERYYLAYKSGRRKSGWLVSKRKTYYLDPQTGILTTGLKEIDGSWYYLKPRGKIPGEMARGFITVQGKRYYAKSNGKLVVGLKSIKGKKYYFSEDHAAAAEWVTIGSKRYYFDPDKYYMRKGWLKIGDSTYFLNKSKGYAVRGWKTISRKRYYFDRDYCMVTGLQSIKGSEYLFDSNGELITGKRAYKYGDAYYTIASNGAASPITKEAEILACRKLDEVGWDLQKAFTWAALLTYRVTPQTIPSGYTQAEYFAQYGFEHEYGDCYVIACVFYKMADMLGYNVRFMKGVIPTAKRGEAAHGWVEVYDNGKWNVCDPNFTSSTGRNGYMINYGMSGTWRYGGYSIAETNEANG